MQKRVWKKEEKIAIIREAEEAPTVTEILRKYNVAPSIYYKWKRQFEAYGESAFDNKYYRTDPEVRRLESENQRLKKLLVEKELEIELLEECVKKKKIDGKEMVELVNAWNEKGLSVLEATKILCFPRSTYYSDLKLGKGKRIGTRAEKPQGRPRNRTTWRFILRDNDIRKVGIDDEALLEEILNLLSNEFVCYGYHKVTWFLRRNGYEINHKKVYRLVKEFHLLRLKLVKHRINIRRVKGYKV